MLGCADLFDDDKLFNKSIAMPIATHFSSAAWPKVAIDACERLASWSPKITSNVRLTIVGLPLCRRPKRWPRWTSNAGSLTVPIGWFFRSSAVVSYGGAKVLIANTCFSNYVSFIALIIRHLNKPSLGQRFKRLIRQCETTELRRSTDLGATEPLHADR